MKYTLIFLSLLLSIVTSAQRWPLQQGGAKPDTLAIVIYKYQEPVTVNQPPVARLGIDMAITLPVSTVTLNGSTSTDPDGTIISYQFSQASGPSTTVLNPVNTACNVSQLTQGVYIFRLTVTDNGGLKATDDIQITVNPAVIPPSGAIKYLQLPIGVSQTYSAKTNLIIDGLKFSNKNQASQNGNALQFMNCTNVTIRNCYFASSSGCHIYTYGCTNVKIENCLFAYGKGFIIASTCKGGIYAKNCEYINGFGSGGGDGKDGGFYKLVECTGPGYGVENCRGENFAGESNPEDIISLYKSAGTAASPILITGNTFKGGGPSQSGGGIVAGDGDGAFTGGFVNITNNTLLNPGQYGIAAAGGTNIRIEGNKIYGDKTAWSNNPLFVWNQYAPACNNITVKSNRVRWIDRDGNVNNGWNAGNCSSTVFEPPTPITLAEMGVPSHLFQFITPAELITVRASK